MRLVPITILFLLISNISLWSQNTFLVPFDTLNIDLNAFDDLSEFDANDEYLVIRNHTNSELIIYSIDTGKTTTIELVKGRGPNEYLSIFELIIDENNIIYLSDIRAFKFLKIDVQGKFYEDINYNIRTMLNSLIKLDEKLYISTSRPYLSSHYHELKLAADSTKIIPLYPTITDKGKSFVPNTFYFTGVGDANKYHLIHINRYHPTINVYPLGGNGNQATIPYDDSEKFESNIKLSPTQTELTMLPPEKVNVLLNNMFIHPKNDRKIYINADGETKNKIYDIKSIYEFDLIDKKFTNEMKLGFEPFNILRHNEFVYFMVRNSKKGTIILRTKFI